MHPQQLFLAHLAPFLKQTKVKLDGQMHGLQTENEKLVQEIRAQEEEVERMVSGLEATVADLEGGNEVIQGAAEDGKLRKDAKEIDAEIAARREGKVSRL